jgi:hypothetical protein
MVNHESFRYLGIKPYLSDLVQGAKVNKPASWIDGRLQGLSLVT